MYRLICLYFKEVLLSTYFIIVDEHQVNYKDVIHNAQVTCGSLGLSTATVKLIDADDEEHVACCVGTGPVDAAYKAVDLIVKV